MNYLKKLKLIVMISGEGTNLQALINAQIEKKINTEILAVISDNEHATGLNRAKKANIPCIYLNRDLFSSKEEFETEISKNIIELDPDLIILAGFMRVLGKNFINKFKGKIINIHPSLLPALKGLNTHERAIDSGNFFHGASVHFVIAELDSGPSIMQYKIAIKKDDNKRTLKNRVHKGEYLILVETVKLFTMKNLKLDNNSIIINGEIMKNPILYEEDF